MSTSMAGQQVRLRVTARYCLDSSDCARRARWQLLYSPRVGWEGGGHWQRHVGAVHFLPDEQKQLFREYEEVFFNYK